MIGGIFAISRRFYEQIHGYDEELLLWGGENIDLSFKVCILLNALHIYVFYIPYKQLFLYIR